MFLRGRKCPSDPKDTFGSSKTVSKTHGNDDFLVRLVTGKIRIWEEIGYGREEVHAKY
jgi:hypothetical protein